MQKIPSEVWHMSGIIPKDDNPRYQLSGLYFHEEDKQQRVAATDGKALLVLTWPLLVGEPIIEAFITWEVCNLIHKTKANRYDIEAQVIDGELSLKTQFGFEVRQRALPEGFKWPKYREILKDFHDKENMPHEGDEWFCPTNLSRCLDSVGRMRDYSGYFGFQFVMKTNGPVYFSGTTPGKTPITIEGCLMPLSPPDKR